MVRSYPGGYSAAFLGCNRAFLFFQMRGQLDHYAMQDIETIEGLLYFDRDGRLILREDYHNHPQSRYVLERLVDIRRKWRRPLS